MPTAPTSNDRGESTQQALSRDSSKILSKAQFWLSVGIWLWIYSPLNCTISPFWVFGRPFRQTSLVRAKAIPQLPSKKPICWPPVSCGEKMSTVRVWARVSVSTVCSEPAPWDAPAPPTAPWSQTAGKCHSPGQHGSKQFRQWFKYSRILL